MLENLEQIRREALASRTKTNEIRNGSLVHGHWRHYQTHSVWIEAHDRCTHNVTRTRKVEK